MPEVWGEWIAFAQLAGGMGYQPVFKKRVIDRIARQFADKPETFLHLAAICGAKTAGFADLSVIIEVFEAVPVLITLYKADEEFAAGANIHFDKNIDKIFCTEDIVVMSELVVSKIT